MTRSPNASRARKMLIAGVVLMAAGAISYALTSAEVDRTDFEQRGAIREAGDEMRLTYGLASGTTVLESGTIMGSYRFTGTSGDVYVLDCADHARLLAGAPLRSDATVLRDVQQGMFHVRTEDVLRDEVPAVGGCESALYVVLAWPRGASADPAPASAIVELVQNPRMEGPLPILMLGAAGVGLATTVAGAIRHRRERRAPEG